MSRYLYGESKLPDPLKLPRDLRHLSANTVRTAGFTFQLPTQYTILRAPHAIHNTTGRAAAQPVTVAYGGGGRLGGPGTSAGQPGHHLGMGPVAAAAAGTVGGGGAVLQARLPVQLASGTQQLLTGMAPPPPVTVAYGGSRGLGGPGTSAGAPWQPGRPLGMGPVVAAAAGTAGSTGAVLQMHLPVQHNAGMQQVLTGRAALQPVTVAYGGGGGLGGPGTSAGVPWQPGHHLGMGPVAAAAASTVGGGGAVQHTAGMQQLQTGRAAAQHVTVAYGGGGGLGGPGTSGGLTWQQGNRSGQWMAAAAAPGTVGTVVPVQQERWPAQQASRTHQQLLTGRVAPLPAMAALGGGGGLGGTSLGAHNEWEIRQQILGNRRAN